MLVRFQGFFLSDIHEITPFFVMKALVILDLILFSILCFFI